MKTFFNRRKSKQADSQNLGKIAVKLQSLVERLQTGWAEWMERQTSAFSRKKWTVLLVAFVLLSCGISSYLGLRAFSTDAGNYLIIDKIKKTAQLPQSKRKETLTEGISLREYQRLKGFRVYMDSLGKTQKGRFTRDSIIHLHPGLMDSVRYIEQHYQSQFNK